MVQLQPQLWEVKSGWLTGLGGSPSLLDVLQASERPPLKNLKKKKAKGPWRMAAEVVFWSPHLWARASVLYMHTCEHAQREGEDRERWKGREELHVGFRVSNQYEVSFLFNFYLFYNTSQPQPLFPPLFPVPPPLIPTSTPLLSSPRREQTSQDISWTQHKVE